MSRIPRVLLLVLALAGCRRIPTEKERQGAEIRYELGIQAQQAGNVKEALAEFQRALELDPEYPEANNAMAILLHLAFRRPEEAILYYRRALEVRPNFSEARTNLANVYLDQGNYEEAIRLYEQSLNDMLYPTPYIAQSNMGWALYKKGEVERGIESIKASVTTNPGFCMGYRNLALIYGEQGDAEQSCRHSVRYREACADVAEAWMREGVCQARAGKVEQARQSFTTCEVKARPAEQSLKEDCQRLREAL
jgi:type IV pilus assembly protein PilF